MQRARWPSACQVTCLLLAFAVQWSRPSSAFVSHVLSSSNLLTACVKHCAAVVVHIVECPSSYQAQRFLVLVALGAYSVDHYGVHVVQYPHPGNLTFHGPGTFSNLLQLFEPLFLGPCSGICQTDDCVDGARRSLLTDTALPPHVCVLHTRGERDLHSMRCLVDFAQAIGWCVFNTAGGGSAGEGS
jgi:hypothetical protein